MCPVTQHGVSRVCVLLSNAVLQSRLDGLLLVTRSSSWSVPSVFFLARVRHVNAPARSCTGNSTATARDPARGGTTYGPLEVVADLKEPVSALKARMVQKAAESGYIAGDDKDR